MRGKRTGLILSVTRLWAMSLAFRLYFRPGRAGFAPGLRNLLAYEIRRGWHALYERDRLRYAANLIQSVLSIGGMASGRRAAHVGRNQNLQ